MARPTKTTRTVAKPATSGRKAALPNAPLGEGKSARTPQATGKSGKLSSAPARKTLAVAPIAAAATPAPKLSKEELRGLVEKQEGTIATLRAKSRETNKAAKAANNRIAELEAEVARLQQQVAARGARAEQDGPASAKRINDAPAKQNRAAKASSGAKPPRKAVDPGDGVPPGVAVEAPEPLDEEAEAVKKHLEENLAGK